MDTLEILAKHISPNYISRLLGPLRDVISGTESHKTMRDVDDVLRHIVTGLQANPNLDYATLLTLSQALISQNTDFLKPRKQIKGKGKKAHADYEVQLKRAAKEDSTSHYSQNAHRFVSFGLDLLNGAFRRNKFDIHDQTVIARLDPLISLVGNTLFAEEPHILERALRAVTSLIRCPLSSIDRAAPVLVKQMMAILEHTGGTSSELAQTAIRTLATIIRDRKTVELKDEQLASLIATITPDLQEAEQQAALFSLLRSIVSRTFVVPEIYDLMDQVAEMLVTNQSSGTREICRSIYLQFLLDYPQGKKRLATSMEFLAKNLGNYVHESGRMSALELVNAILSKFGPALLDQYASLFFIALNMSLANDQSSRCREMAAESVKVLIARVSDPMRATLLEMIFQWADSSNQKQLLRIAAQVLGLSLEALNKKGENQTLAKQVLPVLSKIIESTATESSEEDEDVEENTTEELDWQVPYQSLQSLSRLFRLAPSTLALAEESLWQSIRGLLLFPHVWVRNAAARLLGVLYTAAPAPIPLVDLIDGAAKSTNQLRSKLLDEALSTQVVKNLYSISKMFIQTSPATNGETAVTESDAEEEDEAEEGGAEEHNPSSDPLHWLFVKLSHRARVAHQTKPSKYVVDAVSSYLFEPCSISLTCSLARLPLVH